MLRLKLLFISLMVAMGCGADESAHDGDRKRTIREVNEKEIAPGKGVVALVGATLIDGNGGAPLVNACVIVRDHTIETVGRNGEVEIPDGAVTVDLSGLTMLPGLIDAHYHNEDSDTLAGLFLQHGVTSVRDPGEWIESYDAIRQAGKPIPRLFLAGPHIDAYPPAYPADSYIAKDPEEAALAVRRFAEQGASVIKVYYGLPVGAIRSICNTAHQLGLPVTGHLEITNARDAIEAGLDGIEHVTSFGTCLIPMRAVERYKQQVMADHNARRRGRYNVWASLDLDNNAAADSLTEFLADRKTFVSPTLAVFERRADRNDSTEITGFTNMMRFVGKANKAGVTFVVGSHSFVPYADLGWAYHREMELLHESGLTPMEVIEAATLQNARFFRVAERLGSIEKGKIADLVVVEGDPLKDISAMRNVKRVMLNGSWVLE